MDLLRILDTKPIPSIVDSQTLGASGNISGNYWLPTTMCLYQKELTDQIVSLHYSDILRYFETTDFKEDVILESMRTMCLNSEYVATHPYLLIDHYMPKSLITRDIPAHLAETSGKFTVLRDLINLVQDYETNTVIVCRPGRTTDLLEALLLGNRVNIKRYDGNSIKSKQKKQQKRNYTCTCHIFPSSAWDSVKYPITKDTTQFDMFIALDPTVDITSPSSIKILEHARYRNAKNESRAPIVHLTAINSVDHCDLYFSKKHKRNSREFLECVTAAVVVLRDRVGILPPDLRPIYSQQLNYLIEWLEDPLLPWPLPDIYPVKRYTAMDVERSLLSEVRFSQIEDLDVAFGNKKRGRSNRGNEKDDQKVGEVSSYYESKRLKNNYSTNPTKQNMAQLTGITTGNSVSSSNYHLSSEILTHKLIQSIGQIYIDINLQNEDLKAYSRVNSIEVEHLAFFEEERRAIHTKYDDINSSIEKDKISSKELEESLQTSYSKVEIIEREIEELINTCNNKGQLFNELKGHYLKAKELTEEIAKEKRLEESKSTEKEYMTKEIKRAKDSITESELAIVKLNDECASLQTEVEKKVKESKAKCKSITNKIDNLKAQLITEEKAGQALEDKLEDLMGKLKKAPIPRIRVTNSNHSNRRSK